MLLFGSRSLVVGRVPQVGSFQAWPGVGAAWADVHRLLAHDDDGFEFTREPPVRAHGRVECGAVRPSRALAQSIVIGGALPLGAFGAYRLLRPFASSSLPGIAAAAAYAANPIARNAIFKGELGPLIFFALAPFLLGVFVRASLDDQDAGAGRTRRRVHAVCTILLLAAIAASVWPAALLLGPAIAVAFCIALPFVRGARYTGRAVLGAVVAAVGAALVSRARGRSR